MLATAVLFGSSRLLGGVEPQPISCRSWAATAEAGCDARHADEIRFRRGDWDLM